MGKCDTEKTCYKKHLGLRKESKRVLRERFCCYSKQNWKQLKKKLDVSVNLEIFLKQRKKRVMVGEDKNWQVVCQ